MMHWMRVKYILLGIAMLAAVISYAAIVHAQGIYESNLSYDINTTTHFINTVNKSGYLIFYPNLKQAYGYLNQAKNQSNVSYSYVLLAKARASAQAQLDSINTYKKLSLYVLIASGIFLSALLYYMMLPRKKVATRKRRRGY